MRLKTSRPGGRRYVAGICVWRNHAAPFRFDYWCLKSDHAWCTGMTARTVGDFTSSLFNQLAPAGSKKLRRTGQPVRRNSYQVGERERRLWKPIANGNKRNARRIVGARLRAIRQFDRHHRKPGERMGPIGEIGIEVYECLCVHFLDFATGRCDPSIDSIRKKIRRSRKAVVQALARLKEAKFLEWIRRTVKVEENEGTFAPQVKQISNAYGFTLPSFAQAIVDRILGKAPPPDDAIARRSDHQQEMQSMLNSVSCEEFLAAAIDVDGELGDALRGLARSRDNANSLRGQNPGSEG